MNLSAPVLLSAEHTLDDFTCGVTSLDEWLKRRAYPNQVSGTSRTYVVNEGKKSCWPLLFVLRRIDFE